MSEDSEVGFVEDPIDDSMDCPTCGGIGCFDDVTICPTCEGEGEIDL